MQLQQILIFKNYKSPVLWRNIIQDLSKIGWRIYQGKNLILIFDPSENFFHNNKQPMYVGKKNQIVSKSVLNVWLNITHK